MSHVGDAFGRTQHQTGAGATDAFGLHLNAFGAPPPDDFFSLLGRFLAVGSSMEYLLDRLGDLPQEEIDGEERVARFRERFTAGRNTRNALVHSRWFFGVDVDPEVIVGIRYKTRKPTSGTVSTLSISDVEGSEQEQDVVRYTMNSLRTSLRKDIMTLEIGQQAYSAIMVRYAANKIENDLRRTHGHG